MSLRVVVLASGTGSLCRALIDAQDEHFDVVAVISDVAGAGALAHGEAAGIETRTVELSSFSDRAEWDVALAAAIAEFRPSLIVSAGFMRVLGASVLKAFPQRIINTHPALLPAFPGAHAVRDALAAGVARTGCTVHVVDAGVDTGPVIVQEAIDIRPEDDETTLHERIKAVERRLLVDVVRRIAQHGLTVHDGRARVA